MKVIFTHPARLLALLLTLSQFSVATGWAADPAGTLPPGLNMADVIRVNELNRTAVGSYFGADGTSEKNPGALDAATAQFTDYAKRTGLFAEADGFTKWWNANKKTLLTKETLTALKNRPIGTFVTEAYLRYVYEESVVANRADPRAEAIHDRREITEADRKFLDTLHGIDIHSWATWMIGTAFVTTTGVVVSIGNRVVDSFFLGPIMKLTNTLMDPLSNPPNNALSRLVNRHFLPRTMWWARMWSGERRQQRLAAQSEKSGKILKGSRYSHPAMSVADLAESSNEFFAESMQAGAAQSSAMSAELAHARAIGLDLVYNQYSTLALSLTAVDNSTKLNQMAQAQVNRPALLAAGATEAEVGEFSRLVNEREDAIVYRGVRDSTVAGLEPKIESMLSAWHGRGVPMDKIEAFYQTVLEAIVNQNRAALLLAGALDGERFIPENHQALTNLPKMQQWREQAREMSGFYTTLERHADRVQKYFDGKGVKYSVRARLQERGFPVGGHARPAGELPVEDCFYKFKRLVP